MPLCHLPSIPIEKLKCSSPDLVFANTRIERCSATEAQRQVLFMRLGGVEMAERERSPISGICNHRNLMGLTIQNSDIRIDQW